MQSRKWSARRVTWVLIGAAAFLVGGPTRRLAATPPPSPGLESASTRPRLVVALVYDQLGSDTLLAVLPWLDEAGAIRQAIRRGVYFERSAYPYASTLTAPGHATIHTGVPPSESGIDGNAAWDAQRARSESVVEDEKHGVFGRETDGVTAGPGRLRVATVAEALKAETKGVAKVVSLSFKDRSAILSVGTGADAVLWFDSKLAAYTSSSVWGSALPGWVSRYQSEHPVSALFTPWQALTPAEYARRLGPDDAPGEGDLGGLGTTFPHGFEHVTNPVSVLGCMPAMSEYLVGLAQAAVKAEGLGQDDVPDLVALSISGTDCAGHIFGPNSWEYVDHLVRADRAVGAWLTGLEQTTRIALLITSDHGVAPLPERRQGPSGRVDQERLRQSVEAELVAEFGVGPWLAGTNGSYLYLTAQARQHKESARILLATQVAIRKVPGLRDAWRLADVRGWCKDTDPLRRALCASVAADTGADLMFVTRANYSFDLGSPAGKGTNHGSPYDYDRQVPVLALGPGVPHRRQAAKTDQLRVAPTLAALLGVKPPATARAAPLF